MARPLIIWQYCALRQPLKIWLKWWHWCEQKDMLFYIICQQAGCQVGFCTKRCSKQAVFLITVFVFYGSQGWDICWTGLNKWFVAWPTAIKHVWRLSTRCHTRLLSHICGKSYIREQLVARVLTFYHSMINCNNDVVKGLVGQLVELCQCYG